MPEDPLAQLRAEVVLNAGECARRHQRQNTALLPVQKRADANRALLIEKFGRDGKCGDFRRMEDTVKKHGDEIEEMKKARRAYLGWSATGAISGSSLVYLVLRFLFGG